MADLGTDLSCVTDIDPAGAVVSGRRLLAEACARRLGTDNGTLIDDPNYGFNLMNYCNADVSPADIAALEFGAEAECLKDERVVPPCTCVATLEKDGTLDVKIEIDDGDGPFTLVLDVSAVSVDLLKVGE